MGRRADLKTERDRADGLIATLSPCRDIVTIIPRLDAPRRRQPGIGSRGFRRLILVLTGPPPIP
jgi:hypothetical protein